MMMPAGVSLWAEIPVALLLILSGIFTLTAAIGVVRFKTFFQRMHPPALAFSFSAWCVTLASIVYFSAQDDKLALRSWLIIIFLSLTKGFQGSRSGPENPSARPRLARPVRQAAFRLWAWRCSAPASAASARNRAGARPAGKTQVGKPGSSQLSR